MSESPRHVEDGALNQPPPLAGINLFAGDPVLQQGFRGDELAWARERLGAFGELLGRPDTQRLGQLANRYGPVLETHDRFGRRIDEVDFHPAWHELMRLGVQQGVHNLPWIDDRPGAHLARSASLFLLSQVEAGVTCPLSMSFAAVPTLNHQPDLAAEWLPRLASCDYDPRFRPAEGKRGVLVGMAMTEKQGGSDLRANQSIARPLGSERDAHELFGHKWFCSAPMCDAFLTLARTDAGLTCFLVPRFKPDGERNRFLIQRLKDKLGNRSNASSEIEYDGTWARQVGEGGRGIVTIIEMVHHTRLDCVAGSAAQMRQALWQATHHAAYRSAFGQRLARQPLMLSVLADLAIEVEAATLGMLRLARSFDAGAEPAEAAFSRLATPVLKYWICKRAPGAVGEALECVGGDGYVEESILPRLYREAPLMSIWEGSGNVMCLDVLRALRRMPESSAAFLDELRRAKGMHPSFDKYLERLERSLRQPPDEAQARLLVQRLALALQAALLLREGHPAAAEGFVRTRLDGDWLGAYGCLPAGIDAPALVERHTPGPDRRTAA